MDNFNPSCDTISAAIDYLNDDTIHLENQGMIDKCQKREIDIAMDSLHHALEIMNNINKDFIVEEEEEECHTKTLFVK